MRYLSTESAIPHWRSATGRMLRGPSLWPLTSTIVLMTEASLVPIERITSVILLLRGHKVMLDAALATGLYAPASD